MTEKSHLCCWLFEVLSNSFQAYSVLDTVVGYMAAPSRSQLSNGLHRQHRTCRSRPGHADPQKITYTDLVKAFSTCTIQPPETARSDVVAISSHFYHDPEQQQIAEQVKSELDASGKYRYSIVTQIVPAGEFYRAEEYHQQYYAKHILRRC